MAHDQSKSILQNRRAVSQIIGSLIVLAIVASIGSVILFQGLNQINAFNHDLSLHDKEHSDSIREDILFQHVKFDQNSSDLILYLANIGSIETTVESITVVKIDTQELIFAWAEVESGEEETIQIDDHIVINSTANLTYGTGLWNQTYYNSTDYKISITTSKGNFFSTIATPYDT